MENITVKPNKFYNTADNKKYIYIYSEPFGDMINCGDVVSISKDMVTNITTNETYAFSENSISHLLSRCEETTDPDSRHPFQEITNNMFKTYCAKNHDYGDSFTKSLDTFGTVAAVIRMNDKMNRLTNLINNSGKVKSESLRDTLMDLANYAIMTTMYLDDHKEV